MDQSSKIFDKINDTILSELGVGNLSAEDKTEVDAALMEYFNKVIIETVILNLDDAGVQEFKKALSEDPAELEKKIIEITSRVPDLAAEIEKAVQEEILALKSAKEMIK